MSISFLEVLLRVRLPPRSASREPERIHASRVGLPPGQKAAESEGGEGEGREGGGGEERERAEGKREGS